MPLLVRIPVPAAIPLWIWAAAAALLIFALDHLHIPNVQVLRTVVFYTLWALFGFALAKAPQHFRAPALIIVFTLALAALIAWLLLDPAHTTLNMQRNKFPPNALFFLFSCVWVSFFLCLAQWARLADWANAAKLPLLRPFVSAGYSIYLWQGIGYTIAVLAGQRLGWPVLAVWPLAVAISVILGSLAAPLEQLRFTKKRAAS